MTIRPVTKKDIPELAQVHRASWVQTYQPLIPDEILCNLSVFHFQSIWENNLKTETHKHLLAECNKQLIGFISFSHSDVDTKISEISSMYLDHSKIGRGFGKSLIKSAFRELKTLEFNKILLWAFVRIITQLNFINLGNLNQ
jgi:L-amino acid N-acyltransferase YncA